MEPFDVAVAKDGSVGIALLEYEGAHRLRNTDNYAAAFTARLQPKGSKSRFGVTLPWYKMRRSDLGWIGGDLSQEEAIEQFSIFGVGHYLDNEGLPEFTPSGTPFTTIPGGPLFEILRSDRKEPSDEAVMAYLAGKLYWGWRFGMKSIQLSRADYLRMPVPEGDIERIALAGEGTYWEQGPRVHNQYLPLPRLLRDVPAGRFPTLERSAVVQVSDRLQAPRYEAVLQSWNKAQEFMVEDRVDYENAAKEAASAVESLALLVLDREKGTLGDCIKELRSEEHLPRPFDKAFEALWGYASEEAGVRHGKSTPANVEQHHAALAQNLAASAILYLLELDK